MQKKYITSCVSFKSSFWWITLEATQKGLKKIRFGKFCDIVTGSEFSRKAKNDILDYLQGKNVGAVREPPLRFDFSGLTPIQIKMIKELQKIKYGETISYKELANRVGTSPRACGRILASNPFPIIIPCHRVIRADGSLGGYSGGIKLKKKLLKLEHRILGTF
ncbi:methylated-DNA--[protein]-cysteine S-methyltransferase [candidate division WOR-3 bacterium]|nr:methylated-DNA--[protein]-cysteine S-methyltransferase [candidate division WOR-3 bacterium]